MKTLYDQDIFEHEGFRFRAKMAPEDGGMGPPWEEHDGHGSIRHTYCYGGRPDKSPGERVIHSNRGDHWIYDVAGAIETAKKDGWGLSEKDEAALRRRLKVPDGWPLTKGQIVAEAVEKDIKYCAGWLNNDWCWMYVTVELLNDEDPDSDEDPVVIADESTGGIEGEGEYLTEIAYELAGYLADAARKRQAKEAAEGVERQAWAERDVLTI